MSERISRLRQRPDPALVAELEKLIAAVTSRLDEGKNCDALVAQINALSGRDYGPSHFFELHGWTSERDAAEAAAIGPPPAMADLSRDELVEIMGIFDEGKQPESDFFIELLERNFPGSWSSDLLYYPHRELTGEEVVDELLLRRDLCLSGGKDAVRAREVELAHGVRTNADAQPWSRQWADGILGPEQGQ